MIDFDAIEQRIAEHFRQDEIVGLRPPYKLWGSHAGGFMPDGSVWSMTITYHPPRLLDSFAGIY